MRPRRSRRANVCLDMQHAAYGLRKTKTFEASNYKDAVWNEFDASYPVTGERTLAALLPLWRLQRTG
ncbi:hypothetical protein GCM10027093_29220 [Paraburkholderia jirisanensis]